MSEHDNVDPRLARVAPTWEVELLISGVAVFAMLQLPGWLDEHLLAVQPRLTGEWQRMALLAYLYAKSAAVILAITFILHLGLRARWIALVGMDSVFPGGVRADRLRMGPIQRSVETSLNEPTAAVIERADNRASVVFALGVMITMFVVTLLIMVSIAYVVSYATIRGLGLHADPYPWALAILLLAITPLTLAGLLDHNRGTRPAAGSKSQRTLAAIFRFYQRIGMGRGSNWILALLASHGGERKALGMLTGIVLLTTVGVGMSRAINKAPERFGSYGHFPVLARGLALNNANYDDRRNPVSDDALPYIPSLVADGDYLPLVVPYRPERNEAAMDDGCPHADKIEQRDERGQARLACLQSLHVVTLDGQALTTLQYEVTTDPRTARPALLAMIDLRGLARGRHELRVTRPPKSGEKPNKERPDPAHDRIVFWN